MIHMHINIWSALAYIIIGWEMMRRNVYLKYKSILAQWESSVFSSETIFPTKRSLKTHYFSTVQSQTKEQKYPCTCPLFLNFSHQYFLMLSKEKQFTAFGLKRLYYAQLNKLSWKVIKLQEGHCLEKIK